MEQVQRTCEMLRATGFSGKSCNAVSIRVVQSPYVSCVLSSCAVSTTADVDVMECVRRPYEVKNHTLTVPSVGGAVSTEVGGACGTPSLGSAAMWTAQATNNIPAHTGYLVLATLHNKSSS